MSGASEEEYEGHDVAHFGDEIEVQRAVKIANTRKPQMTKEFVAEVELQLNLKHKNIVSVVAVCMQEFPFLAVLEYVLYGDLKKVITTLKEKDIALNESEQIDICNQIACAMDYVTKQNIVHMDLAARNCLVHAKSVIKLADFGLARPYTEGANGFQLRGSMKIPFLWAPPECYPKMMYNKEFSKKKYLPVFNETTDIWGNRHLYLFKQLFILIIAFGVVAWEVATYGEQPFGASYFF